MDRIPSSFNKAKTYMRCDRSVELLSTRERQGGWHFQEYDRQKRKNKKLLSHLPQRAIKDM